MHGVRRGAAEAVSFAFLFQACLAGAVVAAAAAQGPHPFLAPVSTPHFSLSTQVAALDLNRDGSEDIMTPGLFFGTVMATLDEDGNSLAQINLNVGIVPNANSPTVPTPVAMASGDLDHDGRRDLVFALGDGTLYLQRNLGGTRVDQPNFAPPLLVDSFSNLLAPNPPFSVVTVANIEIADFDGDGRNDIAIGTGLNDVWSGIAGAGFVGCYLADGTGGFTASRYLLTGSVLDLEWADVDGDLQPDHLVVIQEVGSAGVFQHELLHLALQNGALSSAKPPLLIGPGRPCALEVGDVDADGLPDYVMAMAHTGSGAVDSSVVCFHGDGNGNPNVGTYTTLPLPFGPGIGSFIPSVQLEDFDRDGALDLVVLRGYTTTYPSISLPAQTAPSDVYYCTGPTPFAASPEQLPLDGFTYFGHSLKVGVSLLPIRPEPDQLNVLDLGADGNPDLLVAAVRPAASPTSIERVTLRNGTGPLFGGCAFVKVGEPSGGNPQLAARIGFDGGEARIGNAKFECTIQNVRSNCLCGLMWGPYAQANLVHVHGFDLHIGPLEFGYAIVSSGTPSHGFASYPLPIPSTPALVGDAGYFQYNYYDPSVDAFGATQATGLWIGG